jgi:hypothetical protein
MKRVDFVQLSNKRGCLARDREDPETQTGSLFGWPQINSKEIIFPTPPLVQAQTHTKIWNRPITVLPLIIFPSTPLSFNDCPFGTSDTTTSSLTQTYSLEYSLLLPAPFSPVITINGCCLCTSRCKTARKGEFPLLAPDFPRLNFFRVLTLLCRLKSLLWGAMSVSIPSQVKSRGSC